MAASPTPSVRVYLTERIIDGSRYGEEICARSVEEAVELAARIGSVVVGTMEAQECAKCGAVLRDGSEAVDNNEWSDTIDA